LPVHQYKEEPKPWMPELTPAELPDAHLVRMAQRDAGAFVHLYDRYVTAVYRYCACRLSATAAEDATSITFLNALKAIDRFDLDRVAFRPWLFTIAHNAVIDQTRVRRHEPINEIALEDPGQLLDDRVVAIDQGLVLIRAIAQLVATNRPAEGRSGPPLNLLSGHQTTPRCANRRSPGPPVAGQRFDGGPG